MSFQSLVSGSECSVAANPLSKVLSHSDGDRSLQQDRLAGPSSSRLNFLPSSSSAVASEKDLALARQFFEANGTNAPALRAGLSAPRFHGAGPDINDAWVIEQQQRMLSFEAQKSHHQASSGWANEFASQPQHSSVSQPASSSSQFQQQPSMGMYSQQPMYGSGMGMGMNMYQSASNGYMPAVEQDKGKGKIREADFEAAFAQAATMAEQSSARIEEVTESMASATISSKPDAYLEPTTSVQQTPEDLAQWESEFNTMMGGHQEADVDYDFESMMQSAWKSGAEQDRGEMDEPIKFDSDGIPILGDYAFEQNNKYLAQPSPSHLAEAKALLEQNGSLSEAALLLEAAIQKGDLGEGGFEAWILLGETRNMDERETQGMRALQEGVRIAEGAGAAGSGMLSLAISYTNESFDRAAHTMLLKWLRGRYPDHHIPDDTWRATRHVAWDANAKITEVFLSLARNQHQQGILDPEVQIALGVLFYSTSDYDRAKDCFSSALSVRPEDYLLWNRLGSSLSNGSKPEEALGAYREALQLRPTYTRAIYNVGVACLNIGAHQEAAEHFLSALAMQDTSGAGGNHDTSDQLWSTLRRTFLTMGREDLSNQAQPGVSLDTFRQAGFDF
ncbi:TPR-like protein [Cylindrobasidium torrendii FP15055 ss-10]|uniref:TPR-like protein n=1 Tax=Cylindrobasidium torrendii FP15055 ss-10 TaxID=1314674 RepID=A0A0D7BVX1_9AGAR|nr:TPR-like protein [Cylindrobasidium torrendii FP15055 ss-10]